MYFTTLAQRIKESLQQNKETPVIKGLGAPQYFYFFKEAQKDIFSQEAKNHLFVFDTQEKADSFYELVKSALGRESVYFFPGFEHSPYGGHIASERVVTERFFTLNHLATESKKGSYIITTLDALHQKNPSLESFKTGQLKLEVSDIVSPDQLKSKCHEIGYENSTTVEEPGTFSHKGEIFDIYPSNRGPIRIHYFDDMIEEIFEIDKNSLKTQRDKPLDSVNLGISPRMFCRPKFSQNLRAQIPMPPASQKGKFDRRKKVFNLIGDGFLFDGFAAFMPLFTEEASSLFDFLNPNSFVLHIFDYFSTTENWSSFYDEINEEFQFSSDDIHNDNILPQPEKLYFKDIVSEIKPESIIQINEIDISVDLNKEDNVVQIHLENFSQYFDKAIAGKVNKGEFLKAVFEKIKKEFEHSGEIVYFYSTESSKREFDHLLEVFEFTSDLKNRIRYEDFSLERGGFYKNEKLLLLTEGDLFSIKRKKVKEVSQKDLDLFAEQISTLTEGDYVIHNEHGVGKYLGLQSLDLSDDKADFLVIEYSGKDKVYVPVYKMNLIQKHASGINKISLDSLRTNKFSALKKRAKQSVKKLAFDLLKLQAERESVKAYSFSPPDHDYRDFELAFEFQETPDQTRAIEHVLEDMQKSRPMDHLVCGDVGFGKTEVAIRAAYKAVLDKKQVAVLVPTTILALQHYNSFQKRLKKFPVNVEFISRFKSPKETKEILEKLSEGKIDILIGTHKLLSDKVKFSDLGLVIVDEEQRFGVNHKEKLKLLKSNVDFLTLTATPIPRTLQLSFLGLRDLSLIKTAPPKRQSIKSYIIKEDGLTIQTAIRKELKRGGQVFIVHNKVNDIEEYAGKIKDLVPEASLVIGHGQLPEKELEKRIQSFYSGDFQILLATTIIESGIDIPNANTMIIDRADTYGLSQLHQLRGRIGRSDKKAYCYFVIPSDRNLSNVAEKRLKALQMYAEMGSGFNIASSDLEIRGAGDILGASQSGHIEAIGLELYMELLQDAIRELKGEKRAFNKNIEITAPFPSYIPSHYIEDSSERLKQYKTLSNTTNIKQLDEILDQLKDLYGPHPIELQNLRVLLEARIILIHCGILSVQLNQMSISIQFDKPLLDKNPELAGNVAKTFLSKPNLYHFSPDYKVLYKSKRQLNQEDFLSFCREIAEQIVPC